MNRRERKLFFVYLGFALSVPFLALTALALTPAERKVAERALAQAEIVKGANTALQAANKILADEAEQAHIEASNANTVAMMAASSAMTTGLKAKNALNEAARCKKENEAMRPIVAAVSGPWWFPGLNALLYGIKKCSISLLVIVAGIVVILVIIKLTTGLSFGALFTPIIGFFAKIPGWISRGLASVRSGIANLKPKPKP